MLTRGVEPAVGLDGGVDQVGRARSGGDVALVRDGVPARRPDLGDDGVRRPFGVRGAVQGDAQVVDDDPGALGREGEGVGPAEPPAGTGDDDDPARADSGHVSSP